jgi:hypothetical protein
MGMRSRNKGKRGEREAAAEIRRILRTDARRGRQFCGSDESPDVVADIENVHLEVKRAESCGCTTHSTRRSKTPAAAFPLCSTEPITGRGWPSFAWTTCRSLQ